MAKAQACFRCAAPGCGITELSEERTAGSIVFHSFPKAKYARKQWLLNLGIPDFEILTSSVVCSRHFSKDSYERSCDTLVKIDQQQKYLSDRLKRNVCPFNSLDSQPILDSCSTFTSENTNSLQECNVIFETNSCSTATSETTNPQEECNTIFEPSKKPKIEPVIENISNTYIPNNPLDECESVFNSRKRDRPKKNVIKVCNETHNIGIQCVIPPERRNKKIQYLVPFRSKAVQTQPFYKSVKVQTEPFRFQRNKGVQYICDQIIQSKETKDTANGENNEQDDLLLDVEEECSTRPSSSSYPKTLNKVVTESKQPQDEISALSDSKFIVFGSALLQLFVLCTKCFSRNSSVTTTCNGSMVIVNTLCPNDHAYKWKSQPEIGCKPAGNILTAAAIIFSGLNPINVLRMLNFLKLKIYNIDVLKSIQKAHIFPVVKYSWEVEKSSLLESLNGTALQLSAYCIYGSSKISKYKSYCILENNLNKIIHLELVQGNQVKTSKAVEVLTRALKYLMETGMTIGFLGTDCPEQTRGYLKRLFPQITQLINSWYLVKSLKIMINKACGKKKNMRILLKWSKSIENHLLWAISSSDGDRLLMQLKWKSILSHLKNEHLGHWGHFDSCFHEHYLLATERTVNWFSNQSEAYQELQSIVIKITKGIAEICPASLKSSIETHQEMVKHFVSEQDNYSFHEMQARLTIASLHYNENSEKLKSNLQNGTSKPNLAVSSYDYVEKLMSLVTEHAAM